MNNEIDELINNLNLKNDFLGYSSENGDLRIFLGENNGLKLINVRLEDYAEILNKLKFSFLMFRNLLDEPYFLNLNKIGDFRQVASIDFEVLGIYDISLCKDRFLEFDNLKTIRLNDSALNFLDFNLLPELSKVIANIKSTKQMTWRNNTVVSSVNLGGCNVFNDFDGMTGLIEMVFEKCKFSESFYVPEKLETIMINNCKNIDNINFSQFSRLRNIGIVGKTPLNFLDGFSKLNNLETLFIGDIPEMKFIESIAQLKNLYIKNAKKKDIDYIKNVFPNLNTSIPLVFHTYL